jgi:hypothetical protein
MIASNTDELREAVSRARKGDTIFALPGASPVGLVLPEGVSIVTSAEAVDQSWRAIQWAISLYRAL